MQNKPHLCFILPGWVTKSTGGAELQVHQIVDGLLEKGYNITVLTTEGRISKPEYVRDNVSYVYYKQRVLDTITLAFFPVLSKLMSISADVLYIRTDARIERAAVRMYCKLFKKKYIFSVAHDEETKNLSFKETVSYPSGLKRLIRKIDVFIADLLSKNGVNADVVTVQTLDQQKLVKEHLGLDSVLVRNAFSGESLKEEDIKENIVLWVGNMRGFKRPEKFLEIVKQCKELDYTFVMIGKQLDFKDQIESIKQSNFIATGELSYAETNAYFRKAKYLICTSDSEGFSNTFLQAWNYKVLILSINVDPDGILKNNGYGFMCSENEEIHQLLVNQTYESYSEKLNEVHAFVQSEFSIERSIQTLENVIHNLGKR